jgi:sugar (pentulose or hexulose) kinase
MYSIGIDVGTTNCKICLFNLPNFELVKQYGFPTPKNVENGNSDFDINTIWDGIIDGLKTISNCIDDPENIISIGVASVGESGILLDENDSIIGPVITWYDTRTTKQLDNLIKVINESALYEITGIPAHSNYSINKIKWIMERNIESVPQNWLCLAEYVAFKLSGEKRSEYSLASRTMALNINKKNWSEEITNAVRLPKHLFSPLVEAGKSIGGLLPELANLTGLPQSASIAICGHDHMCGSVAVGLTDEDQMLNSTGTTEGLLIVSKKLFVNDEFFKSRLSNGIHVLDGLNTVYASLPSAGYAVEWYKKLFDLTDEEFIALVDELNEKTDEIESGQLQSIFIPHLRGSGPPKRSIFSRALLYGIDENTSKLDVLKAVFEGLCLELKFLLETYEDLTGKTYKQIKVIGAACKNEYWLRLKASILEREIVAYQVEEAVSKGAAILSSADKGHYDLDKLISNTSGTRVFYPDQDHSKHYRNVYNNLYRPIYQAKVEVEQNYLC